MNEEIAKYLERRELSWEAIEHPETLSAAEEARVVGIDPDHIAKTLLLHLHVGSFALAILPGGRRVDKQKLVQATGDKRVRLAHEEEMREAFPAYELGALPPLPVSGSPDTSTPGSGRKTPSSSLAEPTRIPSG